MARARLGLPRLLVAALLALSAPLGLAGSGAEAARGLTKGGIEAVRGLAEDGAEAARALLTGRDGPPAPAPASPRGPAAPAAPAVSLETRVSRIEGVLPHLATKADLLVVRADMQAAIHASETALRKDFQATIQATETRLEGKMDWQFFFLLSAIGGLGTLMLGGFWWMYQLHVQLLRTLVPFNALLGGGGKLARG